MPPPPPTRLQDERLELAWAKNYVWGNGAKLRVCFTEGEAIVRQAVQAAASGWLDYANVSFVFTGDCKLVSGQPVPEIRIAFDSSSGSWSRVGTLAKDAPPDVATMNFGWLHADTAVKEYHRVVLHEFGHALGCIHEHQSPNANISWDKSKIYQYYKDTNQWDPARVDSNILKLGFSNIGATLFDPRSIMMYWFPPEILLDHAIIPENTELSDMDKDMIAKLYPRR